MSRRSRSRLATLPAACALGALLFACGGGAPAPANVILVTLDTTRPDYLGTYGARVPTPAFDRIADEGARFEMAISASAVTPVSHATILTGKYPYTHGLRVSSAHGGFRLPRSQKTLAQTLKARGYSTGAVHSAFPVSGYFGFDRDFDRFESFDGARMREDGSTEWDVGELQRRSDETTDIALAMLAELREPFFLWIHYWDPHDPDVLPPPEYLADVPRATTPGGPHPHDELYAAEVRYLDAQFGRLLDGLDAHGLAQRTHVTVTADHGQGLSDGLARHGWALHRMVYQEQIRVPLLMRGPGIAAGVRVPDLVRTADIVPTLLDYLGFEPAEAYDGTTLRGLVEGGAEEPRSAYADQINDYDMNAAMKEQRPDAKFLYCVMDREWKLIYRPHMPAQSELFHLAEDPGEERDLFAERPDVAERLLQQLAERRPWVLAPFEPDAEGYEDIRAMLESLHYTGSDLGDNVWAWTCPRHPDFRTSDDLRRHAECGAALVPVLERP